MRCRCLFLMLTVLPTAVAQDTKAPAAEPEIQLAEDLAVLKPFLGTWEVNGQWSSGTKLWARNIYRVGLNGRFVESSTFAKDGDGDVYERYRTVFAWDKKNDRFITHGFTYNGDVSTVELKTEKTDDGRAVLISEWSPDGSDAKISQRMEIIDAASYRWQVWSQRTPDAEKQEIMNAVWKRQ